MYYWKFVEAKVVWFITGCVGFSLQQKSNLDVKSIFSGAGAGFQSSDTEHYWALA